MKTMSIRRAIVPGIAALALVLSGCGAANDSEGDDSGTTVTAGTAARSLSGTLSIGGAVVPGGRAERLARCLPRARTPT